MSERIYTKEETEMMNYFARKIGMHNRPIQNIVCEIFEFGIKYERNRAVREARHNKQAVSTCVQTSL